MISEKVQHNFGASRDNRVASLSKEELRELSTLFPMHGAVHVILEWLMILTAIWLCQRHWSLLAFVAAVIWIGSRQHALMILMHDGIHYRLFRSRRLNEWISEVALAWPVMISARAYRQNHFAHHRYLNTNQDPDWVRHQGDPAWVFPKAPKDLMKLMVLDLSGAGAVGLLRLICRLLSKDSGVSKRFILARYGFYLAVSIALLWTGTTKLVLMYWFLPLFTWLVFIFRIRSIAEHSAVSSATAEYAQTRTTIPSLFERIFIAPKNVSYHLEHHLFPSVPFYNLPELHALLRQRAEFRDAHVTRTYISALRECTSGDRADASINFDAALASSPTPGRA